MKEGLEDSTSEAEKYRQLVRSLNERVLEQATADPQWKQRFLDDPEAAMADFAEAGRLRDMYESASPFEQSPDDTMLVIGGEHRQLSQSLAEKVLDKAKSAPQWKQQLLEDPEEAMRAAGFPEVRQLQQAHQGPPDSLQDEVRGHFSPLLCVPRCRWFTYFWDTQCLPEPGPGPCDAGGGATPCGGGEVGQ